MQKLKQKSDANPVGANCIRPHFEGKSQNKERGITLIALIITIIVMLILVGVTINVTLNGGLFQKAEQAKIQTQRELEKEELETIAIVAYDEKTRKIDQTKLELGERYSIVTDKTTEDKIVIKGQHGTTWQIDTTTGGVEEYQEISDLSYIEEFFLGCNLKTTMDKVETNQETGEITFDNGKILVIHGEDSEDFIEPGYLTVLYKENYYKILYNNTSVVYAVENFGDKVVFAYYGGGICPADVNTSLSNERAQKPGEYKTKILINNGEESLSGWLVTVKSIVTENEGVELIEGEDYSYNNATGEITIFNLTEIVRIEYWIESM